MSGQCPANVRPIRSWRRLSGPLRQPATEHRTCSVLFGSVLLRRNRVPAWYTIAAVCMGLRLRYTGRHATQQLSDDRGSGRPPWRDRGPGAAICRGGPAGRPQVRTDLGLSSDGGSRFGAVPPGEKKFRDTYCNGLALVLGSAPAERLATDSRSSAAAAEGSPQEPRPVPWRAARWVVARHGPAGDAQ